MLGYLSVINIQLQNTYLRFIYVSPADRVKDLIVTVSQKP